MKRLKKIDSKNLPFNFLNLGTVVSFWFLWEKAQAEWIRTLLVLLYGLGFIIWILQIFYTDNVDIFKDQ